MVYTDGVHLVADTLDELHAFAKGLRLKRAWFQDHKTHPHYDLTTKRATGRAVQAGAVLVTEKRLVTLSLKMAGGSVQ